MAESADGKYLYYRNSDSDVAHLWRMPVEGGPRSKVLEGVIGRTFTVTEHGIYFNVGHPAMELRFLTSRITQSESSLLSVRDRAATR